MSRPTWTVSLDALRLPVWVTEPPTPLPGEPALILASGAGAGALHPWMEAQAAALAAHGVRVVRFDFAYRTQGRKAPDRLPRLMAAYCAVLQRVCEDGVPPARLWLGGKSMGGRVASHVVAEGDACAGLIFYGYPLAPRGQPAPERTAHWPRIAVPALFLTGTRDRLCPLAELQRALPDWGGTVTEHHVADGDHSFTVLKRSGRTAQEIHAELAGFTAGWVTRGGRTA